MRILCLLAFYFIQVFSFAQYSSLALTEEYAKKLGELSKNATLYLVINNEKEPADAALVNAAKKYWKGGAYKFISKAEFLNLKSKNELPEKNLYLFEWLSEGIAVSSMDPSELALYLSRLTTGCYYLASGAQKEFSYKHNGEKHKTYDFYLQLRFDLSSTFSDTKDKILDGYFDLMVKYFNNELSYCQKLTSIKDTKKETKDGIIYFGEGLKDIQTKDILLVKEQVTKANLGGKREKKMQQAITAVSQFNPPQKNIYTVFPEDIKMAVSKNDKQVLIYSNDMLISASDGAVIAATGKYGMIAPKKDTGFWVLVVTVLASAFLIATTMK